ncbi:MAG: LPS export ABC transporter periplasmic protein LptC [Cyclobacteriaceae bacterium]
MKKLQSVSFVFVIFAIMIGCGVNDEKLTKFEPFTGPIFEIEDGETLYSDSARVKVKIIAQKQFEFENGDNEFPEGIYLEFYNDAGEVNNTLRADYCYYLKKDDLWKANGDVIIKAFETKQQLNTEELFWKPSEERMYTDKFVRVETEDQILMGDGLEAKQDFSEYEVMNPTGTIYLDQDNE